MSIKLHSPSGQGRTHKILVAAKLANLQMEFVDTELNEKNFQVFQNKFPFGKVPVLETQEGNLFESNAILRYIARHSQGLYGYLNMVKFLFYFLVNINYKQIQIQNEIKKKTLYQQGLVDQWLDVTINELETDVVTGAIQVLGHFPVIPAQFKTSLTQINHTLTIINTQLGKSKYISGDSLTVADIALAQVVTFAFTLLFGEPQRKQYQHLLKWLNEVNSLPEWRAEFGRPRFPKNAFVLSGVTEEKDKKEKKEKQQEQPKKKEQQEQPKKKEQQEQPKQEEDDDAPKKKEANPLDLLPPSTFNIDDYKRIFFAEKDIQKNIDTLFATIDLNGWSLWLIKYNKSENEGKQLILTNNLMKGFINQRLDQNFRKYAFAIHGVYGNEPNLQLRGAWLWRGNEVPKEWKDHVAYDYHEFIKVDVNNAAQKQLFVDYWIKQEEDVSEVEGLKARSLMYFR